MAGENDSFPPDSNASPSQIPAIAHSQSLVSPGEKLPFVTRAEGPLVGVELFYLEPTMEIIGAYFGNYI